MTGECLYCGQSDSIEHTFIERTFTKTFVIQPTRVELLQQKKKFCLGYLATLTIRKHVQRESLTILSSLCVIIYIQIN